MGVGPRPDGSVIFTDVSPSSMRVISECITSMNNRNMMKVKPMASTTRPRVPCQWPCEMRQNSIGGRLMKNGSRMRKMKENANLRPPPAA